IEMTRGRSDIYDILTHLTFMYIESEKIRRNSENHRGEKRREWKMLEEIVSREQAGQEYNKEVAYTYLSTLLGRTYEETIAACERFSEDPNVSSIFHITYWLGHISTREALEKLDREISFSSTLRDRVGHHVHGEKWAASIKRALHENGLNNRPLHVISANLHSVMNLLYAEAAVGKTSTKRKEIDLFPMLSRAENGDMRKKVRQHALKHGMVELDDTSGTNISVQLFDLAKVKQAPSHLEWNLPEDPAQIPVIFVMDYAFGEQAYETMDELLRRHETDGHPQVYQPYP
ncbi:MAG: hypothetical protein AAFY48_25910, partial [Bacteroidota bacterium]